MKGMHLVVPIFRLSRSSRLRNLNAYYIINKKQLQPVHWLPFHGPSARDGWGRSNPSVKL